MKKLMLFCFVAGIVLACSDENKMARLEIRLTDSPGDYKEVNIDVVGIEIHADGEGENRQIKGRKHDRLHARSCRHETLSCIWMVRSPRTSGEIGVHVTNKPSWGPQRASLIG